MPIKKTCELCNGAGYYQALISMHDDRTEQVQCKECHGRGVISHMTEDEEDDYKRYSNAGW